MADTMLQNCVNTWFPKPHVSYCEECKYHGTRFTRPLTLEFLSISQDQYTECLRSIAASRAAAKGWAGFIMVSSGGHELKKP